MAKKNLTLGAIQKENKRYAEQYEVKVKDYSLMIDREWRPTKINNLTKELIETFESTRAKNTDIGEIFFPYVILLMIKHFTSLNIPDTFEEQVKVLDWLVDGEFLTPIFEYMPLDQVEKVYTIMGQMTDRLNANLDTLKKQIEENEFENPEVEEVFNQDTE